MSKLNKRFSIQTAVKDNAHALCRCNRYSCIYKQVCSIHPYLFMGSINSSLFPRPPPPPPPPRGEAWYTLFVHARNISLYFPESFVPLPCPYAEDYTNQEYRAFFEIHSSDNLTYRTLLGYFSEVPVSFFQT